MDSTELGLLVFGVLAWVIVGITAAVQRLAHHDEIYTEVPPGVVPSGVTSAPHERLRGASPEYDGEIPVAFEPPRGLGPGVVGTVVDGRVDSRDVTATLVDLAMRGHLVIEALGADAEPHPARKAYARREASPTKADWLLTLTGERTYDELSPREARLLAGLFHGRHQVRMSQLDGQSLQAVREDQLALYKEVVARKFYDRHPQQRSGPGCALIGVASVVALLVVVARHTLLGVLAGFLILSAGIMLARVTRGRTPRTALGTAARIQALGFRKYLGTAVAGQFKFEEAAGIFSRYLPYAMVLGVAQHWARTFSDVARNAQLQGVDPRFDFSWFELSAGVLDNVTDLLWFDSFDGHFDLVDGVLDLTTDAADGIAVMAEGVGDFFGSLDFLDGIGDGCDPGCMDF